MYEPDHTSSSRVLCHEENDCHTDEIGSVKFQHLYNYLPIMHAWLLSAAWLIGAVQAIGTEFTPSLIPLLENANSTNLFPMADCHGFKLEEATIDEMQEAMKSGNLTSVKLVGCYLTRTFQTEEYIK